MIGFVGAARHNSRWRRLLADQLGYVGTSGNKVDAWIAWIFASMLSIPLAGEINMLAGMVFIIYAWSKRSTSGSESFSKSLWLCALAISSIVVIKAVSWFWSIAPASTLRSVANHLHFLLWSPLLIVFFRAEEPLKAMLAGARLAVAGLFVWSVWFWLKNGVELHAWIRLEAGAQNPGVLGQLATVLALWMALIWKNSLNRADLLWVFLAVCPVVAAGGRSHIVVMAIGLVCIALTAAWGAKRSARWHIGVALFGAVLFGALAMALAPRMLQAWQEVRDYQHDSARAVGSSVGNRVGLYHVAWKAFPDSPWVGFGAGTSKAVVERYSPIATKFAVVRHYHQQLLQVVMETGLLGLMACFAALVVVSRWMYRDRAVWPYYLILMAVTAGVGLFTGSLQQGLIHTFIVTALAVLGAQRLRSVGGD